ncbi:MAG: hypothetical protein ACHQUC_06975 [Chlamydiales bacterium]
MLAKGNARAWLYWLPNQEKKTTLTSVEEKQNNIIPLSAISEEIQKKILQPIQLRSVGRYFVDAGRCENHQKLLAK